MIEQKLNVDAQRFKRCLLEIARKIGKRKRMNNASAFDLVIKTIIRTK
jgi:hypothetical protein